MRNGLLVTAFVAMVVLTGCGTAVDVQPGRERPDGSRPVGTTCPLRDPAPAAPDRDAATGQAYDDRYSPQPVDACEPSTRDEGAPYDDSYITRLLEDEEVRRCEAQTRRRERRTERCLRALVDDDSRNDARRCGTGALPRPASVPGDRSDGRSCVDITSYDWDWHNDMLCTRPDGTRFTTDYAGAAAYLNQ